MNGISLLFALAAVGVTAQVEPGPGNVPTYTIRIESVLLDQLRRGPGIEQNVAVRDREVRRFKIVVTPEKGSLPRATQDPSARSETLVGFEVVQAKNEFEMWVQLAPERVETLAQKPVEGEIPLQIPEISRYKIFVGVGQLPSQQSSQPPSGSLSSPYVLATDGGLATAGAEARTQFDANSSRFSAPQLRSLPQNNSPSLGTGAFGTGSFGAGSQGTGSRAPISNQNATSRLTDVRGAYRNSPDQSSIAPPPIDRYSYPQGSSNTLPSGQFYGADPRNSSAQGGYFYDNSSPQSHYDRNQVAGYGGAPTQPYLQGSPSSPGFYNPGYPPPQNTIAARPDNQSTGAPLPNNAYAPPFVGNSLPANNQVVATNPVSATGVPTVNGLPTANNAAATVSTAASKTTEENPSRSASSAPLILTTLALFTPLGVNTYLGWLAYSFFWRYRDAVNDSVRARSQNMPGRQAA